MGLHAISEDSTRLSYHCNNPNCQYHNCANWEPRQTCTAHDTVEYVLVPAAEMRKRLQGAVAPEVLAKVGDTILIQPSTRGRRVGKTRQVQITDPGIEWTGPDMVALPMCECSTQMFLKVVFTPDELEAPNIKIAVRDPQNPTNILRIDQHPMVPRHLQFAQALKAMGKVWTPPQ
jgi:hypothetical protein